MPKPPPILPVWVWDMLCNIAGHIDTATAPSHVVCQLADLVPEDVLDGARIIASYRRAQAIAPTETGADQ